MPDTAIMTTSRIEHPVDIFFQRKLLTRVLPALLYHQFGQQDKIPKHSGSTSKWRRYTNLGAQTTPVGEGVDNSPLMISKNDIQAVVAEYEGWTKESSFLKMTGLNAEANERADVLLECMRLTIDTLCRDGIRACGGQTTMSSGDDVETYLNKTDLDTIVDNMLAQNCKMMAPQINAGQGQGTSPIRESFIGIGHVKLRSTLQNVSGFLHVSNYAKQEPVYKNEFGSTGDIRWLLTTNAYNTGGNYYSMILGKNFFGNVKIDGNSADKPLIYTPPDKTGSPGQRYSMLAWVMNYVVKILNDHFGHLVISTIA